VRSSEIEAALVGRHSHAFRFVKKQKDCRIAPSGDPVCFPVEKAEWQDPKTLCAAPVFHHGASSRMFLIAHLPPQRARNHGQG